jgi:hypothetical protein
MKYLAGCRKADIDERELLFAGFHSMHGMARVFVEGADARCGLLEPVEPCLDSSVAVVLHQRDDRIAEPA